MRRVEAPPRAGWQARLEGVGITYHSNGVAPVSGTGGLNWHEGAHWLLTAAEVDALEDATAEIHRLCLAAVDHVVRVEPGLMRTAFGMPDWFADYVARSWLRGDPSLMGRMDLAFGDEVGAVKLLEYNADTPTLAIETAVAQWHWLEDVHPGDDQFNSLHEKLLARLSDLRPLLRGEPIHFAAFAESAEEWAHATYFRDLAQQAGIDTRAIDIPDIGWDGSAFRDMDGRRIAFLHKLYPWEWAVTDAFGRHFAADPCGVLEPPWKALLSDKAILAVLWTLFPGHPNLLPAHPGRADGRGEWVTKPCLGREGANVRISRDGATVAETPGTYGGGEARWVTQAMARLPERDGWRAVVGSWVVGDVPAGVIFREAREAIVRDASRVVPHRFVD